MKRQLLISVVTLVLAGAQGSLLAAPASSTGKPTAAAASADKCELKSTSTHISGDGYDLASIQTETGWTGGCLGGKRDGHGVLSNRDETRDNRTNVLTLDSITRVEATYVAGEPIGLRCLDLTTYSEGAVFANSNLGCGLAGVSDHYEHYRKTGDGRWRELEITQFVEPAVFLEAGSLETVSERLIADARAGNPVGAVKLNAQTTALDDVVRDGRYVRLIDRQPLDLKNRRVAVVLTGHALAELDRFRKMRLSFIDQSAHGRSAPSRAAFIENSDPDRLLGGLAAPFRGRAKSVVPAEDLTPLSDGLADYALVVDWNFRGNFVLSPKDFEALPLCNDFRVDSQCAVFFAQNSHAWLLDRDLEVLRSYPLGAKYPITSAGITDRKYASLVDKLASGFEFTWRIDIIGAILASTLSQEK